MKKTVLFLLVVMGILSCKKQEEIGQRPPDEKTIKERPLIKGADGSECYEYVKSSDTIQMSLIVKDKTVSGNLVYKLFRKDKNIGTLLGIIKGDTIIADYTFVSEGIASVRQLVFLKKGKTISEGFGVTEEKNKKRVFVDIKRLKFPGQVVLTQVDCKN